MPVRNYIAIAALFVVLSGCSFFEAGEKPETRALEPLFAELSASAWEKLDNSENQLIYKSRDSEDLFGAVIRDCSLPEGASLASQFRQLFVGLSDIRILSRKELEIEEGEGLATELVARYAQAPIIIATASYRLQGCMVDIIFWTIGGHTLSTSEIGSTSPVRMRDLIVTKTMHSPELLEELVSR